VTDAADQIAEWRAKIDELDDRLLELLNERARYNAQIGRLKQELDTKTPFVPGRELDIFERLEKSNPGPFPTPAIRKVFREIISASIALQRGVRVAYLGPQATYTHQAAIQQFGQMADLIPTSTTDEIFEQVEAGLAEFGVVPVENSNEGVVSHTLDLFVDSPLTICAEIHVAVHHDLLSVDGDVAQVREVYSHPQALAQCRGWLELNLAGARQFSTASTAAAAEQVAGQPGAAAIASPVAAELYGLRVIRSGIEDHSDNTTRFLVISQTPPPPSRHDITSLLFSIKRDQSGALYRALEPFALNGVNLTRIESRPTRVRAWEYVFFCDFEGHASDPTVARAIDELRPRCDFVKVLGSYPQAAGPA
jgi:chorismate mutase/prephenate dehydratase